MKRILLFLSFIILSLQAFGAGENDFAVQDTNYVKFLIKQAYLSRLSDPAQTIATGQKALALSQKLNYTRGIAQSYRMTGIGQYYMNFTQQSILSYINALTYFQKLNDLQGEARIYNNIGNLYRDNDYDRSLEFFNQALALSKKIANKALIANSDLNLGSVYLRKKSFNEALKYYNESKIMFTALKDSDDVILCSQNIGDAYFNLNQLDVAEKILLDANKQAKAEDMNESVASIDLILSDVYIQMNKFPEAEKTLAEGMAYAQIIKDNKLEHDFKYTNFQLEYKRKNWKGAVDDLREVYRQDSVDKKTQLTSQIMLFEVKHKQEEQEAIAEIAEKDNQYQRVRFWGVTSVAGLLLLVVGLLVTNVKRKTKTNSQLTELNAEISRQKDNLDRVNHHLEEIIDERTKDLQTKNKKLSDYSSYLSHQIRGPIATLKGLLNLEKEGLVSEPECIKMMDKCVSEIDEKILETSEMMHDNK
jgi:tetratricopeptide (TPR) repeat protein